MKQTPQRERTAVNIHCDQDVQLRRDPTDFYWEEFYGARQESTTSLIDQNKQKQAEAREWLNAEENQKHQKTQMAILAGILSLVFPPIGCFFYCMALDSPISTPRGVWARRVLYFGCFLSCVYSFVLASLLGTLRPNNANDNVQYGVGYPY